MVKIAIPSIYFIYNKIMCSSNMLSATSCYTLLKATSFRRHSCQNFILSSIKKIPAKPHLSSFE